MYRKKYFTEIVSRASILGFDTILLEFENKIQIDWLRQAIHPDAWSTKDLTWFLRLCRAHRITVIPKVPLLGHLAWVLQWPWWAHLRENNDVSEICPHHPETATFTRKLLGEVLSLFPDAPAIHLGGDETESLGSCPRCQATGKTKARIYTDHYLPLIQQVEHSGRQAMMYGDMLLTYPEALEKIPKSVIVCDWDYWSGGQDGRWVWGLGHIRTSKELDKLPQPLAWYRKYLVGPKGRLKEFPYATFLKEKGFPVVLLPTARCGGDNYCAPMTLYHVQNAMAAARHVLGHQLDGIIITSWATRFNHLQTNWPSIAATAWTFREPEITAKEVSRRFSAEFFGLKCDAFFEILDAFKTLLPDLHAKAARPTYPNILHKYIEYLYRDPASAACRQVEQDYPAVKKSFHEGFRKLAELENRVRRNRSMFRHWVLAGKTLVHKVEVLPDLMRLSQKKSMSRGRREKMLREIDELVQEYKQVFGPTMPGTSLDMEIRLRFQEERELIHGGANDRIVRDFIHTGRVIQIKRDPSLP